MGSAVAGVLFLALLLGSIALCQIGYGSVAPFIPGPLRGLLGNPEYEADNADYFRGVEDALQRFTVEADNCQTSRDQRCLTKAIESLRNRLDTGVPATASWMSSAHSGLVAAIFRLLQVHRQSERSPITSVSDPLYSESRAAIDQFQAAFAEWVEQSKR